MLNIGDFYSSTGGLKVFSINLKVGGSIYMTCFLNVGGTEEPFFFCKHVYITR